MFHHLNTSVFCYCDEMMKHDEMFISIQLVAYNYQTQTNIIQLYLHFHGPVLGIEKPTSKPKQSFLREFMV